ncbi:aldehyde dehydrogenase family protein [Aspergillus foveolatus]|uniref:aldehyde dehydrogenase family protein n=1 Tax=Aspergillus foveolatus TaxID=210207 RepID=UPI003CCDFBD2
MAFSVFDNYQNTINGVQTSTAEKRHGINPATGEPNPDVPVATAEDVDKAVAAAEEAFKTWSEVPFVERQKALLAFADAIEKHAEDFAKLLVQEQGKPLQFAAYEAVASVQTIRAQAEIAEGLKDEIVEDSAEKKIVVRHTPIGVAAGIIPWNFPLALAVIKLAPALLTGNVIIIKPSPFTPYCGLKLAELAQQFFPPGVVQALSGDDRLGPWLTAHPGIGKISFTGSSATGKKVMESASKTLKRVTLELGGKDAAIVCKNVDVQSVAPQVVSKGFLNSGQICLAVKRIYVHESIYEEFRDAAVAYAKTVQVGPGTQEGVFMGPLQNSMQYEKVKGFFADLTKEQLSLTHADGKAFDDKPGYFIKPTIIDRPAEDSRIATEEQFGPIVPLLTWNDESEVISRANNTRMGLGASVWSSDLDEAARIASKLQAGSVWVNTHFESDPRAPFGGHKESGIGTENGLHGLRQWCNLQTLYLKK